MLPLLPSWTLRILSGISEGICNTMVQSGGEFLYIGVGRPTPDASLAPQLLCQHAGVPLAQWHR